MARSALQSGIPPGRIITFGLIAVGGIIFGGAVVAIPVGADHTQSYDWANASVGDADDISVDFPAASDHYPGDENPRGASVSVYTELSRFADYTDEEGLYIQDLEIRATWLDFSACDASQPPENMTAYGIDIDNTHSGPTYDYDLSNNTYGYNMTDDGVLFHFVDFDVLTGPVPPYVEPDDRLVMAFGENSDGGPCTTTTEEPGWYQLEVRISATEADNGGEYGDETAPSSDADQFGVVHESSYIYICDCEDEREAREELGPPPGESTPTPASTSTPRQTATPSATADPSPTPTATPTLDSTPTPEPIGIEGESDVPATPTEGDGAGFTLLIALFALLGTTFLDRKRRNP